MWNLKSKITNKTETDSSIQRTYWWFSVEAEGTLKRRRRLRDTHLQS